MEISSRRIKNLIQALIISATVAFTLHRCSEKRDKGNTGMAMIDIDFNNRIENTGMARVSISSEFAEFAKGMNDSCLNLSATADKRFPVIVTCKDESSLTDYNEFTIEVWVKKAQNDNERYVIAGSKEIVNNHTVGWEIATSCNGSWTWQLTDGNSVWKYQPTNLSQNMNDNKWHQLVFSVNSKNKEARIYFDGKNRAVYSLANFKSSCISNKYHIGTDPLAIDLQMEAFNGFIDNFKLWARALSDDDVKLSYFTRSGKTVTGDTYRGEQLSVMTWNIWHGGKHYGKRVGVDRIADVIRNTNPDIVLLQDTEGSGERIADNLGYYFFSRSDNLSVISRFPFSHSYDIFKPSTFGCVSMNIGSSKELLLCPVSLDSKPNIGAYVKTGSAIPDSIIDREMQTRGLQVRFILGELSSFSLSGNKTIILAGDFNSGSHLDWTERNKKAHNDLVVEFPASKSLEQSGFIDTYRTVNPDEVEYPGITWSPVFNTSMQDRIDYIYCKGNALTPVSSEVIDNYTYDFPSSHAAVVTVFSIN